MRFKTLNCPACGAPLPPRAAKVVVVCEYCRASVMAEEEVVYRAKYRRTLLQLEPPGEADVRIAGTPYRLLGLLARGESSDVFLAERVTPIRERIVIKVLRAHSDLDLFERQAMVLDHLLSSGHAPVSLHSRIPQPLFRDGTLAPSALSNGSADDSSMRAFVYRYRSGFTQTLDDVVRAFPGGVEGQHVAWMWRRILEALHWIHSCGVVHGAILPQHLVVHARDHGVNLLGFGCAARLSEREPIAAIALERPEFYPEDMRAGRPATPDLDLVMAARVIRYVLSGGRHTLPEGAPAALGRLLQSCTQPKSLPTTDAWRLRSLVGEAARQDFGPPKYYRFDLPA